jgi:glycerophosphoryl diester phosphodiesterase
MPESIIIAHRGSSGTCPENTLLAFRTAIEAGVEWLELDTQLVENELVVFHDEDLERTTNGFGALADIKFPVLRQLDAGKGERVPLLTEVLSLAKGRAQVNIELKGAGTAVATAALLTRLFSQKMLEPGDVLASSMRLEELHKFQELMPQVRRAPIYESIPHNFAEVLKVFDFWSVHLHKVLVTKRICELAEKQNCNVFAWTVNDVDEAERLGSCGANGIFTDYPERFIIRKS